MKTTKTTVEIINGKPQVIAREVEVAEGQEKVGPCYLCLLGLGCNFDSPWHRADSRAAVELISSKAFALIGTLEAARLGEAPETVTDCFKALKKLKGAVEYLEGGLS